MVLKVTAWTVKLTVITSMLIGMGAWYASGQILEPRVIPPHTVSVLRLDEGRITLERTHRTQGRGVFGIWWDGGYGQVSTILRMDRDKVVRTFRILEGELSAGQTVAWDPWAFPGDPFRAHGMAYLDVTIASEIGDFPAWYVPGERRTWVLFVHGRDATRRESLRMLPVVAEMGFPSLVITYRNDPGLPSSADEQYGLGRTEWKDLDAAASYAFEHGATDLVLFGYSMGGAIVAQFMHRSDHAAQVRGLILDSPLLDWGSTVTHFGREHHIPRIVTAVAKDMFSLRYEADWSTLDEVARAGELSVPTLVFHGTEDPMVPIEPSERLARARPDLVVLQPVRGAAHVESWNAHPGAYETAVQRFLSRFPR